MPYPIFAHLWEGILVRGRGSGRKSMSVRGVRVRVGVMCKGQVMMTKVPPTHPVATYSPQLRSKWVAIILHSRNRWDIFDACEVCYRLSCKVKFVHCKYIHNQVRKQTTVKYHITKWPHGTMTMLHSATLQITH